MAIHDQSDHVLAKHCSVTGGELDFIINYDIKYKKYEHSRLKKQGLVEGRYPNLFVAAKVAATMGMKARQIRDRGFDKKYYQDLTGLTESMAVITVDKHGSESMVYEVEGNSWLNEK